MAATTGVRDEGLPYLFDGHAAKQDQEEPRRRAGARLKLFEHTSQGAGLKMGMRFMALYVECEEEGIAGEADEGHAEK